MERELQIVVISGLTRANRKSSRTHAVDKIETTESWAAEARMSLQSAVHLSNINDPHPLTLIWAADGAAGYLEYRDCLVMFSLAAPQGPVPAMIRIYDVFESALLANDTVGLYNGLQTICLFGVVPMISPDQARKCIVLDGVCVCLVADRIAGHAIIDAIFRVSMAADAYRQESHHDFWQEYQQS